VLVLVLAGPWPVGASTPAGSSAAPKAVPAPAKEDPLARRVCDALHGLPSTRRQACCGGMASNLAAACADALTAAIRRRAITIQGARIDRCVSETERALAGCSWVTPLLPNLPAACAGIVAGTLKEGAACHSSLECVDGLYCRGVSAAQPGVCRPPAAPRSRCELPADNLAAYARAREDPRHASCEGRCERGQCLPFIPAGGACVSSALCVPGLHCMEGKCQAKPLPGIGDACSASNVCEAGAYCDAGKCEALKEAGAACRLPFECRALACEKTPGSRTGKCADACIVEAPPIQVSR
jgi:hypothetical protein